MFELELQDQSPPANELEMRSSPSKVEIKVKAVPGTLECVASSSKQSTKSSKDPRKVDRKEVEVIAITKMLSKAGATTNLRRFKEDVDSLQVNLLLKVPRSAL
ncbi:hypothetical protein L7F22_021413 [Adiantum nelumboides]|nr:hypothetical protein [Adiantum nelumboides]